MSYIIVRVETNTDGTLSFLAIKQITQKGSSEKVIEWIDITKAKSNAIQDSFLCFDDKDLAERLVADLDEEAESIAILRIDAD